MAWKPWVHYLQGSGAWVERFDPRWPRPYRVVHLKLDNNVHASKICFVGRFRTHAWACSQWKCWRSIWCTFVLRVDGSCWWRIRAGGGFKKPGTLPVVHVSTACVWQRSPVSGIKWSGEVLPESQGLCGCSEPGITGGKLADVYRWSIRDKRACDSFIWTDVDLQLKVKHAS